MRLWRAGSEYLLTVNHRLCEVCEDVFLYADLQPLGAPPARVIVCASCSKLPADYLTEGNRP